MKPKSVAPDSLPHHGIVPQVSNQLWASCDLLKRNETEGHVFQATLQIHDVYNSNGVEAAGHSDFRAFLCFRWLRIYLNSLERVENISINTLRCALLRG
jgi:hypothetical protein